jgi:hypothetical protein
VTLKPTQITLGADPEAFLVKDGDVIPACGLVGGTKKVPLKISSRTHIQEDGVAVEWNTAVKKDPAHFWQAVDGSVIDVRNYLQTKDYAFSLHVTPSWKFAPKHLTNPQANTLGCDPDLLADMRGVKRTPPTIEQIGPERFTGGHIHIGYPISDRLPGWAMIKFVEAGAYFRFLQHDPQGNRRKFYGLSGLYREKPYGVEYRTPSAFWVNRGSIGIPFTEMVHRCARFFCDHTEKAKSLWEELDFDGISASISSGTVNKVLQAQTSEAFARYGI